MSAVVGPATMTPGTGGMAWSVASNVQGHRNVFTVPDFKFRGPAGYMRSPNSTSGRTISRSVKVCPLGMGQRAISSSSSFDDGE